MSDASFRLIETLKSADLIAAEDTRVSRVLLSHFNISCPLISFDMHHESSHLQQVIDTLSSGKHVALLSDAGTPTLSDPGAFAISKLRDLGVTICPIPGPSAISTLLSVSGFSCSSFHFAGFVPRKASEFTSLLSELQSLACPLVFFESPHRLIDSLETLASFWPNSSVFLGKELTKHFETLLLGTPHSLLEQLSDTPVKGEWSLAILPPPCTHSTEPSSELIHALCDLGLSAKQLKGMAGLFKWNKNTIYKEALDYLND